MSMKFEKTSLEHGDYRGYLYEALIKSIPLHKSRSPYRTQGDVWCRHCGVFVWESGLQMIHGRLRHKDCGRMVRLRPYPSHLGRLQRKKPKRHYHDKNK